MIGILLAAQVTAAMPAITPEQISTLKPGTLGERLLGGSPPHIVEAFLYGEALEAPPAPGAPVVTRVVLYDQARESDREGFCEKVRYFVRLKPVRGDRDGALPASPAATVTPTTLYRLKSTDGAAPACEAPGGEFLSVSDGDAELVLLRIRELAAAQRDPSRPELRDTIGSIDDELGRSGSPVRGRTGPLTDWRAALQAFPTTRIDRYAVGNEANGYTMTFRAAEWSIQITPGINGFARIALRRFLSSPA